MDKNGDNYNTPASESDEALVTHIEGE